MAIQINVGRRTILLKPSAKKSFDLAGHSFFFAEVQLPKNEFCEKCLGEMKQTATRWQQAQSGPIAGWDIYTFACRKCGHTYEESNSRD